MTAAASALGPLDRWDRQVLAVLALAATVRVAYLAFNLSLDLAPHWGVLARTGLAITWSDFGAIDLGGDFEATYGIGVGAALESWRYNDRGILYLYMIADALTGRVTYAQIQWVNLAVDVAMVVPVMAIARRLAGPAAARVAGVAYALFVPQIQFAAGADFNPWLTYALIVLTWLYVRLATIDEGLASPAAWVLLAAFLLATVVGNEFRTALALFGLGAAGWYWLIETLSRRSWRLPPVVWRRVAALGVAGGLAIVAASGINAAIRDQFSPLRNSFGHSFWLGVGQFDNPVGVREDDGVVFAWYQRQTGRDDWNFGLDPDYDRWLTDQAGRFVVEHPVLYASMAARRAARILVPNMAVSLIADLASFNMSVAERERIARRQELVAAHGWLSATTLSALARTDPGYVLSLAVRVLLMIALPAGLVAALVASPNRRLCALACLPLAYVTITLAPFYVTIPVYTSAHAATLPVVACGWVALARRMGGSTTAAEDRSGPR